MTTGTRNPPTGLTRVLFRAPIKLYDWHLGFLLGGRFILLHHIGRKSGLPRTAVVEVVAHDKATGEITVCSGFGEKSQWFQNLMAQPDVRVELGSRKFDVHARRLSADEGEAVMLDYAGRHPRAAKKLAGYMGFPSDGSTETYRRAGRALPFVSLTPQESAAAANQRDENPR